MVEAKITRQVKSAVEGVLDAQSVADGKAYLTRLRLVAERLEYEAKAIHDIVDAEKRQRRRMAAAPAIQALNRGAVRASPRVLCFVRLATLKTEMALKWTLRGSDGSLRSWRMRVRGRHVGFLGAGIL